MLFSVAVRCGGILNHWNQLLVDLPLVLTLKEFTIHVARPAAHVRNALCDTSPASVTKPGLVSQSDNPHPRCLLLSRGAKCPEEKEIY